LGHKPWEGTKLYSGLNSYIAGREVELDAEISLSQLPLVTGTSLDLESEGDIEHVGSSVTIINSSPTQAHSKSISPVKNSPYVSKKYIPPSSFYAPLPPKPKKIGPLYVPPALLKFALLKQIFIVTIPSQMEQ